ncbi:MAG: arsenate reductase/protein-tyrosine-phosphatase family protein [Anaerolineae bacterium]
MPYRALVLMVCSANVCRSPMAEHMLRRLIERADDGDRLRVASVGTWCAADLEASELAQRVMATQGYDLSQHRARNITQHDVDEADLILVMTRAHKQDIEQRFVRASDKTHLLSALTGRPRDVEDPHGQDAATYAQCRDGLWELLQRGYPRIVALATGKRGEGEKRPKGWWFRRRRASASDL